MGDKAMSRCYLEYWQLMRSKAPHALRGTDLGSPPSFVIPAPAPDKFLPQEPNLASALAQRHALKNGKMPHPDYSTSPANS